MAEQSVERRTWTAQPRHRDLRVSTQPQEQRGPNRHTGAPADASESAQSLAHTQNRVCEIPSRDAYDIGAPRLSPIRRWGRLLVRAWQLGRTRILWGWRLQALGPRSVIGRGAVINNPGAVAIGSHVTIADDCVLADLRRGHGATPKIVIGEGCIMLYRFQCNAAQSVTIGRNVLFASNVLVTDSDHAVEPNGVPVTRNRKLVTRPVRIEDNCWIAQNVVVLKGVTIGHDSIVGANSVVTHDVPPCSVLAGNPGRIVKTLD